MAVYTIAFLKRGPKWTAERTAEADRIQAGHMAHIGTMFDEAILVAAGPFTDASDLRGIFLFGPGKEEVARTRAAQDPAVLAGRLVLNMHPWMGPAGIGDEYRKWVVAHAGAKDEMVTLPFGLLRQVPGAKPPNGQEGAQIFAGHLAYLLDGARSGTLVAAGPVLDGAGLAGLLFYAPGTDGAKALAHANGDPAVKAGWFTAEFHPWMVAKGVLPARWAVMAAEPK